MIEAMSTSSDSQTSNVCAIHQPNFFPWLGYFDKIRHSDRFVFLDQVDYPKSGSSMGSWVNRVRIQVQREAQWVRAPVHREQGRQRIIDVRINENVPWRDKLLKTLEVNYKKASGYVDAMATLEPLIRFPTDSLAEFNINAIVCLANRLGLETQFDRQSQIDSQGQSTEMLIDLVRRGGSTAYLCGGGTGEYQNDGLFSKFDIALLHQNFVPAPYGPPGRFIAGLSVIDFLMGGETYCGWN